MPCSLAGWLAGCAAGWLPGAACNSTQAVQQLRFHRPGVHQVVVRRGLRLVQREGAVDENPPDERRGAAAAAGGDDHLAEPDRADRVGVPRLHVGLPLVHLGAQDARGPGVR